MGDCNTALPGQERQNCHMALTHVKSLRCKNQIYLKNRKVGIVFYLDVLISALVVILIYVFNTCL
jgi:hypothetical protein